VGTESELIAPLLEFGNYGMPLPEHWPIVRNRAQFGADYGMSRYA
jgi:hypothetical protein